MIARYALSISLLALASLTGCSAYVGDFYYLPQPAVAEVRNAPATQPVGQAAPPPAVTAYATVVGVRREDSREQLPLSIEIRLRLDNHGTEPVTLEPRTLELTTGDQLRFPPPVVRPPNPVTLSAGQTLVLDANFPFPPGVWYDNTNLQMLQLRWSVEIDGKAIAQAADFHRSRRMYYDPYWDYPPYPYWYPNPYWGPYWWGPTFIIRR